MTIAECLKAKFTVDGNKKMKQFCLENNIFINETKKIVVAKNELELEGLYELQKRSEINAVYTSIISEDEVKKIDPKIKTYKKALYSPTTAKEVYYKLRDVLIEKGVVVHFNMPFEKFDLEYKYLINTLGAYADKIAKRFGLAKNYTMLPFKCIYLKYMSNKTDVKINLYLVPNLKSPFLGVHNTITVDGSIKIGPIAIPAFWKEKYIGFKNFKLLEIVDYKIKLLVFNSFGFAKLAFKVMPAGIRAQLLNTTTNELVQDFVVEHTKGSTHILNSVSPAFTCAFAEHIIKEIDKNKLGQTEL